MTLGRTVGIQPGLPSTRDEAHLRLMVLDYSPDGTIDHYQDIVLYREAD